jgi:enoyl-CoA hydratase/carnithine racemase
MMDAETWMTAQQALSMGFVDEVVTAPRKSFAMQPGNVAILNCLQGYKHVPEEAMKMAEAEGGYVDDVSLLVVSEEHPFTLLNNLYGQRLGELAEELAPSMNEAAENIKALEEELNVTGEESNSVETEPEAEEEEDAGSSLLVPNGDDIAGPDGMLRDSKEQEPDPEPTQVEAGAVDKLRNYLEVFGPRR